ncbi:integration host factor subunit beta [Buchnera aphidicola str. APS (Acyrthosiphon pisum)]|uniref:Integration host factor subunit beta n=3 Tax=Buchnera aphidicola TaxID=9 RepID=IHFB_BUCAI|nr:integration host factor subunit beta [Buchnera aphidicola]B8D7K1.1 RecName: Full=Integration host factor subunit beta; Short=IHF-beta [Buchnera aphidicola str. Tuc7 (Acyrthosiphon pisum)]B8D999.1 RecName: Full=Integration host factor subunit beta; Short=IHF-beta [Buchnera aphidicola str. 5A (Acyrthosiphon pisum)]P57394.1 RecName: Full=Integration host factor subunit beta; Short=IHF-beta [Buchnera aphidicola str. APS (Acyrthosiphon pisum)]pir/A84966/ integration host factor beta-subunit [impo
MIKSELFERIAEQKINISNKMIERAAKEMLEHMIISLANGKRIEIRGFGSFSLHYRSSRIGRNPKTGKSVKLNEKYVPYFKPGKKLRDRANIHK